MFEWIPPLDGHARATVLFVTLMNATYVTAHYAFHAMDVVRRRWARGVILAGGASAALLCSNVPLGEHLALWRGEIWHVGVALACTAAILPLAWKGATQPAMHAHLPEVRPPFAPALMRRAALGWAVYLFGYELFFRGALQGFLTHQLGVWPALALTTALYTWSHVHKAWTETAGSILMGFVFGLMAHATGGFLAPFALHWLIGAGSELAAARAWEKRA